MKYCEKCGAQLNDSAEFCVKCGSKIRPEFEVPVQEYQDPVANEDTDYMATEKMPNDKKSPLIPIIVAAAVIIVIVVIIIATSSNKGKSDKKSKTETAAQEQEVLTETDEDVKAAEAAEIEDAKEAVAADIAEDVAPAAETDGAVSMDSYTGNWFGSDRWHWEITKTGGDKAKVTYQGSEGAADGCNGVGEAYLNGDELTMDITYTRYRYGLNTNDEEVCAEISEGRKVATLKLASLYPEGYTVDPTEFVLANETAMEKSGGMFNAYSVENLSQLEKPENYVVYGKESVLEEPKWSEYMIWYSSDVCLEEYEFDYLSDEERRIAYNEIYARHGRKFKDNELMNYFLSKSWYNGTIDPDRFDESCLSGVEKYNIQMLKGEHPQKSAFSGQGNTIVNTQAMSENDWCQLAMKYYRNHNDSPATLNAMVDGANGNVLNIRIYEDMGGNIATCDWYYVDTNTGLGTDFMGDTINLFE